MPLLTLLLCALSPSRAESPGVLPARAAVLYTGVGVTTFNKMTQGGEITTRDREVRLRGDLYGSLGLTERLQLSASLPVVTSFILDDADRLPCPGLLQSEGYCDSYVTAGQGRLDLRADALPRRQLLTLGLAADIDRWNAGRRGQYNSAGSGRTMLEGLAIVGGSVPVGEGTLRGLVLGAYGLSLAGEATSASGEQVQAPSDTVRASVEVRADVPGPLAFELGGHAVQRLSGVDLDSAWVSEWFPESLDRWNVLRYGAVSVSGKVSVDLPAGSGLHVGVARVVAVANGASNTTDVSVGWHRYFAP